MFRSAVAALIGDWVDDTPLSCRELDFGDGMKLNAVGGHPSWPCKKSK
jgi:hypothetical protein